MNYKTVGELCYAICLRKNNFMGLIDKKNTIEIQKKINIQIDLYKKQNDWVFKVCMYHSGHTTTHWRVWNDVLLSRRIPYTHDYNEFWRESKAIRRTQTLEYTLPCANVGPRHSWSARLLHWPHQQHHFVCELSQLHLAKNTIKMQNEGNSKKNHVC